MPLRFGRNLRLGSVILFCAGVFTPGIGMALEGVSFKVAGQNTGVEDSLRAASLLLSLEDGSPDDIFAAAKAEYGRLVGALYAQGRYSAVVSVKLDGREVASIAPLDAPSRVGKVEVSVDPGPVFHFSATRISPLAPETDLPKGFAPGEVAESDLVKAAVSAGISGWRGLGHAKAKVAGQKIVADHDAHSLAADVTLNPGPKLRFGPVSVAGNERTRTNRIRKIAGLPEGKVFDPAEIDRAANRLRRTGAFRSVTIAEDDQITSPDLLGMTVTVVPEKPRRLSFGAEISSLDGLDLTAGWMHRNLFGGAERLKIEANVSQIGAQNSGVDYGAKLTFDRPATITPDTTLRFSTEYKHEDEEYFIANGFETSLGFTHVFSDTLTGRIDLGYSLINGDIYLANRARLGGFRYSTLTLPIGLTWDRRDSKTDATKGFYIDAEVKPFIGLSGSAATGLRSYADLRAYRGFGEGAKFVLAGRAQVGAIFGSSLATTPTDDLFFSGGGGTVRGQPYQSLGIDVPVGGTFYTSGGTYFLAASVEARMKVTDSIGVVGFVDAGRVDDGGFFSNSGDWHAGAGVGVRYATGIGPIRLDLAAPIHGSTGKGVQIYIGLGQAF